MRWLVLDEVLSIEKGKSSRSRSRIPASDFSAEVLMMEMMAQTGGILLGAQTDYQNDCIFTKIESAEFTGDYQAGDSVKIEAVSEELRPEGAWIDSTITSSRGTVARSRFMLVNIGRLVPEAKGSITFHQDFMNHFQIREKMQ